MNLGQLLKAYNIDLPAKDTKLIRHKPKFDWEWPYIRNGYFDEFQSIQRDDVFNCSFIFSFLVDEYSEKTVFQGIYKVHSKKTLEYGDLDEEIKDVWAPDGERLFYHLEKLDLLSDLQNRLVLEWGGGKRSWHQWFTEKEVSEILPKGYFTYFNGFLSFSFTWLELSRILLNKEAHSDWYNALSNIYGIYLITDESDGRQYVGSAYGTNGVWGRWLSYINTKTGGNKQLEDLIRKDSNHHLKFRFSLLEVLPNTMTKDEVIQRERMVKEKLGSRAHGLNSN